MAHYLLHFHQEKIDLYIGQVLAYGALLKSGRQLDKEEVVLVLNSILAGGKQRTYILPIAYSFIIELVKSVSACFYDVYVSVLSCSIC